MARSKNNDFCDLRTFFIENAHLQDHLLQSYRMFFITSQSILIPLSALIIFSGDLYDIVELIFIIPLISIGLISLFFWSRITARRGVDTSYWHMQLLKNENYLGKKLSEVEKKNCFSEFKKWQFKSLKERKNILKKYKLLESPPRNFMEWWIPKFFYILWMTIFALMIYYYFVNNIFFVILVTVIISIDIYYLQHKFIFNKDV